GSRSTSRATRGCTLGRSPEADGDGLGRRRPPRAPPPRGPLGRGAPLRGGRSRPIHRPAPRREGPPPPPDPPRQGARLMPKPNPYLDEIQRAYVPEDLPSDILATLAIAHELREANCLTE